MGLYDKDDVPRIGRLTRAPVCNSCGGPTRDFRADGTALLECTKCGKLRTILGAAYRTEVVQAIKAPLNVPMHFFSTFTLRRFLDRVRQQYEVEFADTPSFVASKLTLPAKGKFLVLPGH